MVDGHAIKILDSCDHIVHTDTLVVSHLVCWDLVDPASAPPQLSRMSGYRYNGMDVQCVRYFYPINIFMSL